MNNVGDMIPRTAIPVDMKEVTVLLNTALVRKEVAKEDVAKFEEDLATYLGVEKTFAFNSGRTALYAAIQALDLKSGEEVIVPAYTCAIVFEVVLRLGLKPILVDAEVETYNISPNSIRKSITEKTRAIIPVHLFGCPCDMDQIMEIADEHSLYVIEDVAQALGAEWKKIKTGTFSDLAIFSFGPGKSITSGEGGAVAVNNEELEEKVTKFQAKLADPNFDWALHVLRNVIAMKFFSNPHLYALIRDKIEEKTNKTDEEILENCINLMQQRDPNYLHPTIKLAKMPLGSAKMARLQLKKLDNLNQKRIENAVILTKSLCEINDRVQLPKINDDIKNTFTRYPVQILEGSRDDVVKGLIEGGVDAEKPYYYLIDLFESLRVKAPNAIAVANSILTIPNHPLLRASDTLKIANTLYNELTRDKA